MTKPFVRPAALMMASAAISMSGCTAGLVKPDDPPISLSRMVDEVQIAIDPFWCPGKNKTDKECQSGLPPLKQVKLALQTVRDTKLGTEVDYLVMAVQGSKDNSATQEIDLTLTPHAITATTLADTYDDLANIRKVLIDTITSARESIKKTYGDGDNQLDTDEISVQIAFAVTWDGKVGGAKVPVLTLLASPSVERSIKTTNTITVTFARPHKPAK
jgi:hypothetical protein